MLFLGYVPNSVIRGTFGKEEVSDIDSPHVYPLLFLRRNQENVSTIIIVIIHVLYMYCCMAFNIISMSTV